MDLSPFYRWSEPLTGTPGRVLRAETDVERFGPVRASEAVRLLYESTDVRWNSGEIPVSGTLFLPAGEPPAGGWPLLSWAHGTLGIADACAPSWTGFKPRDAAYINRWLEAGFAVVATDYQGLGGPGPHPYHHWQSEGVAVLDAARAALAARSGLIANRIVIAGQSQGSTAALGAALLANEYANELNVLGSLASGLNASFPEGPVVLPARNSDTLFLTLASGGLRDGAPAIEDILTPEGRAVLATARQGCTREIRQVAVEQHITSLEDALSIPLDELAEYRLPLGDMPSRSFGMPLMVVTGLADATTIPVRQYAAVSALCASGNEVLWKRYEGLGHDGAMFGSLEDSVNFARGLVEGRPAMSNCAEIAEPGPPGEHLADAPFNEE